MLGFVAVTDYDWYEFLAAGHFDEVNFWRPSDTRTPRQLQVGTPVFFKLRKRFGGQIVGYGIFAHHDVFPAWLAWETFEQKNGAPTFGEMRARIERLRSDSGETGGAGGDYEIGCLMLAQPQFFDQLSWIAPPKDYPENAVQGKAYDLAYGEGARIWAECLKQGAPGGRASEKPIPGGYGKAVQILPRLGQGIFRSEVISAYGRACAVTGEHSLPVLEAAHIRPYSDHGVHEVSNGLLLRSDLHRLFDKGYVGIDLEHRFLVSRKLKDDFANGKSYYPLHGQAIRLPESVDLHPSPDNLAWHLETCFRR